jgi:SAM-dependent methyltransferase
MNGFVDVQGRRIHGWAFDQQTSQPTSVDIFVDGAKVGSTVADHYRADLTAVTPDGRCAFEFFLPAALMDGTPRLVEVRASGAAAPLTYGAFKFQFPSPDYVAGLAQWVMRLGWWVLAVTRKDDVVEFGGWCVSPPGAPEGRISVNGAPVQITAEARDEEWTRHFAPNLVLRHFTGRFPREPEWNDLHFSFGHERPFRPLQDIYYPLFPVPMPDEARRLRVHGNSSETAFDLEGYSAAIKLDQVARRFAGAPLAGLGPVLDWGCGCGRTTRFLERSRIDLYGVDIDADNVRWCAENLSGNYSPIDPDPPTKFDDDFFGAIYGISVFTHLDRHYEALWLAELYRIARPGALLLLSVLGGVSAVRAGMVDRIVPPTDSTGFTDAGRNADIDTVTHDSEYYRNVFHLPGYVTSVWGKYFEILSIEEAAIGNTQDLVVARKPLAPAAR